ncbi:MAG: sugar ABC transporter permease [Paracholeplasma sp.]|uniref:ABC-type transport system, permease component n=1 Tax=Acholeplasma brassicae TaxID=61635 RepID=U4KR46_9MOLU|nr:MULTISPECIES: sugar ABC transporter permease [Paracholeplasma]MDY3196463.1 sugar ABC transporter permease [Paracholeplasma sp.]CCV65413.1 ABC-type transport system, permease component [Paracholeplasma brassicae]HBT59888.1 sugar ABC transporter permease [Acholeplasmataceae bacterium]
MEKENTIKLKSTKPLSSYKKQKLFWGVVFLLPWLLGIIFLFGFPLIQSLYYSFFELTPKAGALLTKFVGFDNYIYAFNEHVTTLSSFKVELLTTMGDAAINLPVLLIFSLFIAVMLNAEFKGRAVIRAIFFIPVILNSAAIATALGGGDVLTQLLEEQGIGQIFDLEYYLVQTGLNQAIVAFVVGLIGRIYDILALAGVPILLFLASIQSVPKHLYEAARIEGATSYEMFWLITLPNVSSHILTVVVYALVDTFLTSSVSGIISDELSRQQWGLASAMSWVYVLSVLLILIVVFSLAKFFKIGGSHYEN